MRQDSFYSRSLVNETIAGNEIIHVGGAVQTSVSGLLTSVLSPSVSTRSKGKGTEWSRSARVAAADQLGPSTIKAEAAKAATANETAEDHPMNSRKVEVAPGQAADD